MKRFKICRTGKATVLELPQGDYGSLAESSLKRLERVLSHLASEGGPPYWVVDLSNVSFFGARFVGLLARTRNRLKNRDWGLALCGLRPPCDKLVGVLHLDKLFETYPKVELALQKHQRPAEGRVSTERPRRSGFAASKVVRADSHQPLVGLSPAKLICEQPPAQ